MVGERNGMGNGVAWNKIEVESIEGDESFGDGRANSDDTA